MNNYKLPENKVLVLRTCNYDMTSHGGFKWPTSGPVKCDDWINDEWCGNGLHGFLWGEGNGNLANWDSNAKWLVVEVDEDKIVDLDGKVKFPKGNVIFCGDQINATNFIAQHGKGKAIIGHHLTVGHNMTACVGYHGKATSGNQGTAIAGYYGKAKAGDCGVAIVGNCGTAMSGTYGTIIIEYWDNHTKRFKWKTGCIGEGGLKPNVFYKLQKWGKGVKFVEVK